MFEVDKAPSHSRKMMASLLTLAIALGPNVTPAFAASGKAKPQANGTATPIQHLVVIFQENISFDHYFGTYPVAQNNPGETPFIASQHTPKSINNLVTPLDTTNHFVPLTGVDLLNNNPNNNPATGVVVFASRDDDDDRRDNDDHRFDRR